MQLRQSGVTWQVVGDEVIALDFDGSVYLKINGSGRVLWERLNEPADEAALVSTLVDEYGIDATRAESDVATFLNDLRQRHLLEE